MMNRIIRLLTLASLLGFGGIALAHGPYDSSAQMIVFDESLELSATLGMDGARQVLLNAGLSEADAASALAVRGPSTRFDLSVELAPRFFELRAGGTLLTPQRLRVITDGLEAKFTVTYAGTHSGALEVRARYFDAVEKMKPGVFTAMDENRSVNTQTIFTHAQTTTEVRLTGAVAPEVAGKESGTNAAPMPEDVSTAAQPPPAASEASAPSRSLVLWIGGAILLVGAIGVLLKAMNRKR